MYNESLVSLGSASVANSELSSDDTVTTSSTVPGLGEISGRAILALGKLTLRGAEHIIIRRRLDAISMNFPHQNVQQIRGIEQMYEDILELSRRDLYPDTVRVRALTIILVQIGSRQIQQLARSLLYWPPIEIKIFITELTGILDPLKLFSAREAGAQPVMVQAYAKSLAIWESHSLEPFIIFLHRLAEENSLVSQAVLEGGVMDYLLHLYASDFSDFLTHADPWDFHRTSTLYAACNSLLLVVSSTPRVLSSIRTHPLHALWSVRPGLPFTPPAHDRVIRRAQIWVSVGKELIMWRIWSMMEMMGDWRRPYDQDLLADIAIDILDFSGSDSLEPDVYIRALRALHRFFSLREIPAREAIRRYMSVSNPRNFSDVVSRIITRLSHLISLDTPEWDIFFLPWPHLRPHNENSFRSLAVLRIMDSFTEIAENNQRFLSVIRETNILGLLRPFLQQQLRDPRYSMAQHSGDKLTVYDTADFELMELIRIRGFREVSPSQFNDDTLFAAMERTIVAHVVNIILSGVDSLSKLEAETR